MDTLSNISNISNTSNISNNPLLTSMLYKNIRVINLPRRVDRKEHIIRQLLNHSIIPSKNGHCRIVDGYDSKEHGKDKAEKALRETGFTKPFYSWSSNKDLILGRMGCTISHMRILKEAVEEGLDNILVLEDDAVIRTDKFPLPPDGLCYLGGLVENTFVRSKEVDFKEHWNDVDNYKVWGTHCYLVEGKDEISKLYHSLLKYSPRVIDAMFVKVSQLPAFKKTSCHYLYPTIAKQNYNLLSDVTNIYPKKPCLPKKLVDTTDENKYAN